MQRVDSHTNVFDDKSSGITLKLLLPTFLHPRLVMMPGIKLH